MFRLAIPVLIEQLLVMLVGLIDLLLTSRYLQDHGYIAAIGVMAYVLWMIPCAFGIVAIGSTALTARFVGARDYNMAVRTTNQSLLLGIFLAVLVTLVTFWFGDAFLKLLGMPPDAAEPARRYLRYVIPVIPAMMVQQVGIACLRGAGDTMSGFITMAIVNTINAVVGITLVIGWGPFPSLGWDGLALGTVSGYITGAVIVMILLLRGRAGMQLQKQYFKIDLDLCWRILRIGIPGGADQLFLVACHVWFLSVISSLGTLALAAHSLGIRIESLAYLPGSAFHVAAATMTGQYLGAGDYNRARKSALTATLTGGTLMIGTGFLFYFGAEWLTSIFLVDAKQEVATVTIRLLQMVSISMPSLALMIILNGALRGAGDTRWPLLFTFLGLVCIRIPLAYWLAKEQVEIPILAISFDGWGLGIIGAWYAMIVDVVVRSLMITARFWHGGWQQIRV